MPRYEHNNNNKEEDKRNETKQAKKICHKQLFQGRSESTVSAVECATVSGTYSRQLPVCVIAHAHCALYRFPAENKNLFRPS